MSAASDWRADLDLGLGLPRFGGRCADLLRPRDARWSPWLVAALFIGSKPLSIAVYLCDDTIVALALFVLPGALGAAFMGPSVAAMKSRFEPGDGRMSGRQPSATDHHSVRQ